MDEKVFLRSGRGVLEKNIHIQAFIQGHSHPISPDHTHTHTHTLTHTNTQTHKMFPASEKGDLVVVVVHPTLE